MLRSQPKDKSNTRAHSICISLRHPRLHLNHLPSQRLPPISNCGFDLDSSHALWIRDPRS
eukprot:797489-Rhodomonas_salina.1